jgi:hypothetical protein
MLWMEPGHGGRRDRGKGEGLTMTLGGKKPSVSQATASRPFSVSQSRSSQASSSVQCELCRSLPGRQEGSPGQWPTLHRAQRAYWVGGRAT